MTRPSCAEAALSYAARGWHVLPLWWPVPGGCACGYRGDPKKHAIGKHPIGELVPRGKDDSTTDPDTIRKWFAAYPLANVAITAEPSGFVAIDIDPRNGGSDSLAQLYTEVGTLPETVEAITGGGGAHYLFRAPGRPLKGKPAPGIDIISRGYVVAEPSAHESGGQYQWELSAHPDEHELAELPPKWLRLLSDRKPKAEPISGPIEAGSRNDQLMSIAGTLRYRGLDAPTIDAALQGINEQQCEPPLDPDEVSRIAASASRYEPHQITFREPEPSYADSTLAEPSTPAIDTTATQAPPGATYATPLVEWLGDEEPDDDDSDDWIIRGLVARGVPQFLAGPPKAGKTWLALDAMIAAALGEPWLEQENTRGPVRTLGVLMEDSSRNLKQRVWQLATGRGIRPATLAERLAVNGEDFYYFDDPRCVGRMRKTMELWGPELVVIDSLARSFLGDENSKRDVAALTRPWQELCRDYGATVLVIHHARKHAADDESIITSLRGSGDLGALARHVVGVRRMPGQQGLLRLETDGNLEQHVSPTAIELEQGRTNTGRRFVRLHNRGAAETADQRRVEDLIIAALRERPRPTQALVDEVHGAGTDNIRAAVRRLEDAGRIAREATRKPWYAIE